MKLCERRAAADGQDESWGARSRVLGILYNVGGRETLARMIRGSWEQLERVRGLIRVRRSGAISGKCLERRELSVDVGVAPHVDRQLSVISLHICSDDSTAARKLDHVHTSNIRAASQPPLLQNPSPQACFPAASFWY